MRGRNIHLVFVASLILKGLDSLIETAVGLILLLAGNVTGWISYLVRGELLEDPRDLIANSIQSYLPQISHSLDSYGAFYLLSHGLVKLILVIALLYRRLWAYPAMIGALGLFVLYQVYRLSLGFSWLLVLLSGLDLIVMILTWHEYRLFSGRQI